MGSTYVTSWENKIYLAGSNVGIGTSDPQASLDVRGELQVVPLSHTLPVMTVGAAGLRIQGDVAADTFRVRSHLHFEGAAAALGGGFETFYVTSQGPRLSPNLPNSMVNLVAPPPGLGWAASVSNANLQDMAVHPVTREVISAWNLEQNASVLVDASGSAVALGGSPGYLTLACVGWFSPTGSRVRHREIRAVGGKILVRAVSIGSNHHVTVSGFHRAYAFQNRLDILDGQNQVWASSPPLQRTFGFVVRYDAYGNPQWARFYETDVPKQDTYFYDMACDEHTNDVYLATETRGTSNYLWDHTSNVVDVLSFSSPRNTLGAFLKLSGATGNLAWYNTMDGAGGDAFYCAHRSPAGTLLAGTSPAYGAPVLTDAQGCNVVVDSGFPRFITQYTSEGSLAWLARLDDGNLHGLSSVYGLGTDASCNVYATGTFQGSQLMVVDAAGQSNVVGPASAGGARGFLVSLTHQGGFRWGCVFATSNAAHYPLEVNARGVVGSPRGGVYVSLVPYYTVLQDLRIYPTVGSSQQVVGLTPHRSRVLEFDSYGSFCNVVWEWEAVEKAHIRNLAVVPSDPPSLYLPMFGQGGVRLLNSYGDTVLSNAQNALWGYAAQLSAYDVTLHLPRQHHAHFQKNLYLHTSNAVPYPVQLRLETADGSYHHRTLVVEHSNATLQATFTWSGNEWITEGEDRSVVTRDGLQSYTYSAGGHVFSNAGSNAMGAVVAWTRPVVDPRLAFLMESRYSLVSEVGVHFGELDALVDPADNASNQTPGARFLAERKQVSNSVGFSNLQFSVERQGGQAVQLRVGWDADTSNYLSQLQLEMLATTQLGEVTFTPFYGIHGT